MKVNEIYQKAEQSAKETMILLFGEVEPGEILDTLRQNELRRFEPQILEAKQEEKDSKIEELLSVIAHSTGTENHWEHPLFKLRYTDGVREVAITAEAYWLIDAIFSWQPELKQHRRWESLQYFQHWVLEVFDEPRKKPDPKVNDEDVEYLAVLRADDGNDHPVAEQWIEYTDFPKIGEIEFYLESGVLLLTGEH